MKRSISFILSTSIAFSTGAPLVFAQSNGAPFKKVDAAGQIGEIIKGLPSSVDPKILEELRKKQREAEEKLKVEGEARRAAAEALRQKLEAERKQLNEKEAADAKLKADKDQREREAARQEEAKRDEARRKEEAKRLEEARRKAIEEEKQRQANEKALERFTRHGYHAGQEAAEDDAEKRAFNERPIGQATEQDGYNSCVDAGKQNSYNEGHAIGIPEGEIQGLNKNTAKGYYDGVKAAHSREGERLAQEEANTKLKKFKGSKEEKSVRDQASKEGRDAAKTSDMQSKAAEEGQRLGAEAADQRLVDAINSLKLQTRQTVKESYQAQSSGSQIIDLLIQKRAEAETVNFALADAAFGISAFVAAPRSARMEKRKEGPARDPRKDRFGKDRIRKGVKPNITKQEEETAYQQGYANGYQDLKSSGAYNTYYEKAKKFYQESFEAGCQLAKNSHFESDYQRGIAEGTLKGIANKFNEGLREERVQMVEDYFQQKKLKHLGEVQEAAYQAGFSSQYNSQVELVKNKVSDRLFQELWTTAKQTLAIKEGEKEEHQDFVNRPVRLGSSAKIVDTKDNQLIEPEETLRISTSLRNFSNQAIEEGSVELRLIEVTPGSLIISKGTSLVDQVIKAKTTTEIKNAFEFQINPQMVDKDVYVKVSAYYRGQKIDESEVQAHAVPKYMLKLDLSNKSQLNEGKLTQFIATATNNSSEGTEKIVLTLASEADKMEVVKGTAEISAIEKGATAEAAFEVIARAFAKPLSVPIAIEAKYASGQRVGLLDTEKKLPVLNDYVFSFTKKELKNLRKKGTHSFEARITNVSKRKSSANLQLNIRIIEGDKTNFTIVKQAKIKAIPKNGRAEVAVSMRAGAVTKAEESIVLEIELVEDGNIVQVHREKF